MFFRNASQISGHSQRKSGKRFGTIESLEPRQMMAADVVEVQTTGPLAEIVAETVPQAVAAAVAGDLNDDGQVNMNDLPAVQLALTDPSAYENAFPGLDPASRGDINNDGLFNFGDLSPFVALVNANQGAHATGCPFVTAGDASGDGVMGRSAVTLSGDLGEPNVGTRDRFEPVGRLTSRAAPATARSADAYWETASTRRTDAADLVATRIHQSTPDDDHASRDAVFADGWEDLRVDLASRPV